MSDRYLNLVNSPVGSAVASRVGLPRPAVLRRYNAGDPVLPGAVLLGSTAGKPAAALRQALTSAGVEVSEAIGAGDKVAAVVLDARSIAAPADLSTLREFLAPGVKALGASGRVIVIGRPADGADITVDAARQALDGIVRSLAKDLRRGATANLLLVEGASDTGALPSALRFFLSGKSAYVDGQPVRLGAGPAPAPDDWDQPLAGKTALVTGAARGIGARRTTAPRSPGSSGSSAPRLRRSPGMATRRSTQWRPASSTPR